MNTIKQFKKRRYIAIVFICLVFGAGWLTGNFSKKFVIQEPKPTLFDSTNEDTTYHFDGSNLEDRKKIIIEHNREGEKIIFKDGNHEQVISEGGMMPGGFDLSPKKTKLAYSSGGPSLGWSVSIFDFKTNNNINIDVSNAFTGSKEAKGYSYSHVYTFNVAWHDETQLIVNVTGYSDREDRYQPEKQLYLVDATTGKIIKRIL